MPTIALQNSAHTVTDVPRSQRATPDILTWFDWAENLTTGLGAKTELHSREENNFTAVLSSIVAAIYNYHTEEPRPAHLQTDYDVHGVRAAAKLVLNPANEMAVERVARFMLERLATRDEARAFDIADNLRTITGSSVFAKQLALFQTGLMEGNADLSLPAGASLDSKANLVAAIQQDTRLQSIRPRSIAARTNDRAAELMQNYFKPTPPRLSAA